MISGHLPQKARPSLALLILLLGLAALTGVAAAQPAPLAGKLVYFQGQVEVRRAGGGEWAPGQANQELFAGDAVRTGAVSRAAILCVDETQLKLNENTLLVLKSVAPSPRLRLGEVTPAAAAAAASVYGVSQGEVWLRNKNDKFRFELETPAVTAAIRGTEFNLRVAPDGLTRVTLLEGSLTLANPQGELGLAPGEEGLARPGQAPTKRVLVQPADAVQWSLYYPGILSYRDLPLSQADRPRPAASPALEALLTQGEAAYDQGQLEQARQAAEGALKQAPDNDRALTLMGWVSLQHQAPEEALSYFRRVKAPDEAALMGTALARYRLGDAAGAYELLNAARRRPRPTPVLTAMSGYLALLVGRADEARALLEEATRQAPTLSLPRSLLAQIYLVQNRKDAAKREVAQALAQAPTSPLAQLTMGLVSIAHFDLPGARRHLEKALTLDPRFVEAYVYLAKIWLGSDYLDRAWKTIERALSLAPREAEVLTLAGFIRLGYRDYAQARQFFQRAVKAGPALGEPHLGLGAIHFRYREFAPGLASMLTATLLDPRVSLYQTELGKALYQVRAFDKALEVYEYAKALDPKDPSPSLYRGIALTDLNRPGGPLRRLTAPSP